MKGPRQTKYTDAILWGDEAGCGPRCGTPTKECIAQAHLLWTNCLLMLLPRATCTHLHLQGLAVPVSRVWTPF